MASAIGPLNELKAPKAPNIEEKTRGKVKKIFNCSPIITQPLLLGLIYLGTKVRLLSSVRKIYCNNIGIIYRLPIPITNHHLQLVPYQLLHDVSKEMGDV